jgi:hypothetical protein
VSHDAAVLSIATGDPAFCIQRAVGLVPPDRLGVARRALFFGLLTWLPSAIWAIVADASASRVAGEPVLGHFAVHFSCLVAIPLLILAEPLAEGVLTKLLRHFPASGLLPESEQERFRERIRDAERLRDHWAPWALIGVLVAVIGAIRAAGPDEMSWASHGAPASLGFGGWWFLLVARPLVTVLMLTWLWRTVLVAILFRRIAALDLRLIPSHPASTSTSR